MHSINPGEKKRLRYPRQCKMSQISATYLSIGERVEKKIIHSVHAPKYHILHIILCIFIYIY